MIEVLLVLAVPCRMNLRSEYVDGGKSPAMLDYWGFAL